MAFPLLSSSSRCCSIRHYNHRDKSTYPLTLSFPNSPTTAHRLRPTLLLLKPVAATSFPDLAEAESELSPWEGAVVYRRDASVSHVEYSTTLERLGLAKLSSDLAATRASEMGIRNKQQGSSSSSTPVLVSVDVTKNKKKKLRLDGILRTVITLGCNRCAGAVAQPIFSNFTLLLMHEQPKPKEIEDRSRIGTDGLNDDDLNDGDDEKFIDLDDMLHFPAEQNQLDISKQIRDLVHVEITINAVCDVNCKGLCLRCGANLNTTTCNCSSKHAADQQEADGGEFGPLKSLRKNMQSRIE